MDEVDISALQSEFFLFKEFFDDKPECFDEIHYQLKTISKQERFLVPNVIHICKLLLVNPATSATPERSFSSGRNLKTWQRSTMKGKRFNYLAIFYIYKEHTDKIDFVKVGNEFVQKYDGRLHIFGRFSEEDFKKYK